MPWLSDQQEPDGSWFGRWGVNYVYGTGAAVPALVAAGVAPRRPADPPGRAPGWRTTRTPTADGARTCAPTSTRPGGAGGPRRRRRRPGRCWPCWPPAKRDQPRHPAGRRLPGRTPRPPEAPGTSRGSPAPGSPGTSRINYHLYRLVWPVMALGRYRRAADEGSAMSRAPRRAGSEPSRQRGRACWFAGPDCGVEARAPSRTRRPAGRCWWSA